MVKPLSRFGRFHRFHRLVFLFSFRRSLLCSIDLQRGDAGDVIAEAKLMAERSRNLMEMGLNTVNNCSFSIVIVHSFIFGTAGHRSNP